MRQTAAHHDPVTSQVRTSAFLSTSEAELLGQMLKARQAWGGWLRQFIWHHFVTLTCSDPQRSEAAAQAQFRRWIRRLEHRAQRGVGWFVALERGAGGLLHHHVLTVGTDKLDAKVVENTWPCGLAVARRYDPAQSAAYYVGKDVGIDALDLGYDIAPPGKLEPVAGSATSSRG